MLRKGFQSSAFQNHGCAGVDAEVLTLYQKKKYPSVTLTRVCSTSVWILWFTTFLVSLVVSWVVLNRELEDQ